MAIQMNFAYIQYKHRVSVRLKQVPCLNSKFVLKFRNWEQSTNSFGLVFIPILLWVQNPYSFTTVSGLTSEIQSTYSFFNLFKARFLMQGFRSLTSHTYILVNTSANSENNSFPNGPLHQLVQFWFYWHDADSSIPNYLVYFASICGALYGRIVGL